MLPCSSLFPLFLHRPLTVVETGIESIGSEKLLMRTTLDNLAITHNENAVGIANGAQTVRDHKARATGHKLVKRRLDLQLGTRIDTRGRLVQQEDRRIGKHHASNAQKLLLTLAERAAVLTDHGVVTLRQLANKLVGMCPAGRLDHLLARSIRATIRDVLVDRALEQPAVLQHHAKAAAQTCARVLARRTAVHSNLAGIDVVKAQQ